MRARRGLLFVSVVCAAALAGCVDDDEGGVDPFATAFMPESCRPSPDPCLHRFLVALQMSRTCFPHRDTCLQSGNIDSTDCGHLVPGDVCVFPDGAWLEFTQPGSAFDHVAHGPGDRECWRIESRGGTGGYDIVFGAQVFRVDFAFGIQGVTGRLQCDANQSVALGVAESTCITEAFSFCCREERPPRCRPTST